MVWLAAELPPDIPPACVERAAAHYSLPTALLVAIVQVENGKVGKAYPRKHGTYFGPFQISNKWLPRFEQWGYNSWQLTHNACANAAAGAYVLAYYKMREPTWQMAIARYNVGSMDKPERIDAGSRYAKKVISRWWGIYERWKNSGYAVEDLKAQYATSP